MLTYHKTTEEEKYRITAWKYDGDYAVYNSTPYAQQKQTGFGFANPVFRSASLLRSGLPLYAASVHYNWNPTRRVHGHSMAGYRLQEQHSQYCALCHLYTGKRRNCQHPQDRKQHSHDTAYAINRQTPPRAEKANAGRAPEYHSEIRISLSKRCRCVPAARPECYHAPCQTLYDKKRLS